jgi:hypothetical protein
MSDFTYETPNEEGFLNALLVQLKVEGFEDIAETLKGCRCEIVNTQQFAYPKGRWNALWTEVVFHIPVNKYELANRKVTNDVKNKIMYSEQSYAKGMWTRCSVNKAVPFNRSYSS